MSEPYVGEIKMFASSYAPYGYAFCQGDILQVSQNPALAAVLGRTFGGDGLATFGLPDLRGRGPIGQGQSGATSNFAFANAGGAETVQLSSNSMPSHNHPLNGSLSAGVTNVPSPRAVLASATDAAGTPLNFYGDATTAMNVSMQGESVSVVGGVQPISLRNPYMPISFIIALTGEWPTKP